MAFPDDVAWPRRCLHCHHVTYRNPLKGITVDAGGIHLFDARSAPDGTLLVFGLAPPQSSRNLPAFVPSSETSEMMAVCGPLELAFSAHTEVVARYWKETENDGKTDAG